MVNSISAHSDIAGTGAIGAGGGTILSVVMEPVAKSLSGAARSTKEQLAFSQEYSLAPVKATVPPALVSGVPHANVTPKSSV